MKVKMFLLLAVVIVAAVIVTAFAPMSGVRFQTGDPVLLEWQLVLVGLVASFVLWVLKLLAAKGWSPSREVVAIALYVISFVLALLFQTITFPAFPGCTDAPTCVSAVINYIGTLLTVAAPITGLAYLIYNVLLKRVLEGALAKIRGAKG